MDPDTQNWRRNDQKADVKRAETGLLIAIDPGTRLMGYAVLKTDGASPLTDYGTLKAKSKDPIENRLGSLLLQIQELLEKWQPEVLTIETPYLGRNSSGFFRSAVAIGQAQGLAIATAASMGIKITSHTPAEVKQALTGYGNASKEQMQDAVTAQLGLNTRPTADEADALAVGLCHLMQNQAAKRQRNEITDWNAGTSRRKKPAAEDTS